VALRDKRGQSIANAFEKIFSETVPNFLQTDRGSEFLNIQVQNVFKKYNVRHYWSLNDEIKAAVVERFNRTLKTRMYRYFSGRHTNRWIDVLQSLVDSYNMSFHSTIGMAPNDVNSDNMRQVAERMFPVKVQPVWKFQLGDTVRISRYKNIFEKGFLQNWTTELYSVVERHVSNPPTYSLKDLLGEEIKGRFYEQELQKVVKTDDVYIVDKVLKTRKRNGQLEHFVKWQGYDDKFNSWTSDIRTL
jgi:hypothetical protein